MRPLVRSLVPVLVLLGVAAPGRADADRGGVDPLSVLHRWDARRSRAYADSDAGALRRLYLPGSLAGRRDVRLLASYDARGMHVVGLTTQVLRARPLLVRPSVVRVRVVDRVARGVVIGPVTCWLLPRDRAHAETVTLVRAAGRAGTWRVRSVR